MPYYKEQLLSAWSEDLVYEVGYQQQPLDENILRQMLPIKLGFRAVNPRTTHRNQTMKSQDPKSPGFALHAPRFLSEKSQDVDGAQNGRRISDAEILANAIQAGNTKADVPIMYRNVEIKYSKFGVDDFDFQYDQR